MTGVGSSSGNGFASESGAGPLFPAGEAFGSEPSGKAAELLDQVDVGFLLLTTDWRIAYLNSSAARTLGMARQAMLGKAFLELFPAVAGTDIHEHLRVAMDERRLIEGFHRDTTAGRAFEYKAFPTRDGELCIALTDVSARVQAESIRAERERQLHESEHRFQTMADVAPVPIWVSGQDGQCAWVNRPWLDFTGRRMEEEMGVGWMEGVHPDDRNACMATFASMVAARKTFCTEFRLRRADGEYRWMLANAVVRTTTGGESSGFVGSMVDITERRILEDERARVLVKERLARAEAERANRIKDEFVATLSHELRTPINAILGWAQLLQMHTVSREETAEAIQVIERNARLQAKLISDLLDMSRIIAGKVHLDIQAIDLREVVEDALELIGQAAEARKVRIQREFSPALAPMQGDPARIQQVVWNLLANAIKFSPQGGTVVVSLRNTGSSAEIVVKDQGKGIEPSFLPHIFERFSQADTSTTRKTGGLGLGLAISKHFVELHGGKIAAASDGVGKGAMITVVLPLAPQSVVTREVPAPRVEVNRDANAGVDPLAGIRVLIVDDEPDARELVKRLLEVHGAVVSVAGSSAEGVAAVRREHPEVLISDIGMPGEDGYRFLRRVRDLAPEDGWDVPSIALTAFARNEDRIQALSTGYQAHVSKPVDANELIGVVSRLVVGKESKEQTAN